MVLGERHLILRLKRGSEEVNYVGLFDLRKDADEKTNLFDSAKQEHLGLQARLLEHARKMRTSLAAIRKERAHGIAPDPAKMKELKSFGYLR